LEYPTNGSSIVVAEVVAEVIFVIVVILVTEDKKH
jgi:hypothetical protein